MAVVLTLNVGVEGVSCREKVPDSPPPFAVIVAVCDELTDATAAVKLTLVEDAATNTEAGSVTAELLLARVTARPPAGAAEVKLTVQVSEPGPVRDGLVHDTLLTAAGATATAVRFITAVPCEELLAIVRTEAKVFACAEVNCRFNVAV
jgi:hypothetical protein